MNRSLLFCLLFILPFSLSSCSSKLFGGKKKKKKEATAVAMADTVQPPVPPVVAAPPVVARDNAELTAAKMLIDQLAPLWQSRLSYKTFTGKAKINFDGPDGEKDFTANFRIRKDSVIWVHVTALGFISAARILVTRDSFFLLNFLQKEATRISLKDAAKVLPVTVDFTQLQNLVVGEPLSNGTVTDAAMLPAAFTLTVQDTAYLQHITYSRADSAISTAQLTTIKPNGPVAVIDYSRYSRVSNRRIAANRVVHLRNGDKNYTIDMDFSSTEFDKELEYPFAIPKNYTLKNPK